MSARILLAVLLAAPLLGPSAARADLPPDVVRLEALPGWRTTGGRQMAALRLTLAPGWKTYWRSPGAAGLPPVLDFDRSTGISGLEAHWPVPHVFEVGDRLRSIGYAGTVTIPLELTLSGGPARLEGEVEVGVCQEVCVPARFAVSLALPEPGPDRERRDPAIVAALVDQPRTAEEAGAQATCAVTPTPDGLDLTLRVAVPPQGGQESVVVEAPGLWVSEARSWREGSTLVATAEAQARDGGPAALDRSGLRITVLGDGRAVDIRGCEGR